MLLFFVFYCKIIPLSFKLSFAFEIYFGAETGYIFFLLAEKTLKTVATLFFSIFFSFIFFWWKIYSFPIIFAYKWINFLLFFADLSLLFHDLTWLLQVLKTFVIFFIYGIKLLFFCFLFTQENLYMIYHNSDFFMTFITQ